MLELSGRILLAGDWHGSFSQADKAIRHAKEQGIQTILHLGDFGIWSTDKPYLNQMQHLLGQWGMMLYFIDGNHEDFIRLGQKRRLDNGTALVRENIFHLPRGLRIAWEGLTALCLGGAASIDRAHRREGRSWWSEEYITDADVLASVEGGPVDILFSHDSPATAPNAITDNLVGQLTAMRYYGADVVRECTNHRKQLQRVTDVAIPRLVFHGHYHKYMEGHFHHEDPAKTRAYVYGLDQGTGSIGKSTMIIDKDVVTEAIAKLDILQTSDIVKG